VKARAFAPHDAASRQEMQHGCCVSIRLCPPENPKLSQTVWKHWLRRRRRANTVKFTQHPALAAAPRATGTAELIEDSPVDISGEPVPRGRVSTGLTRGLRKLGWVPFFCCYSCSADSALFARPCCSLMQTSRIRIGQPPSQTGGSYVLVAEHRHRDHREICHRVMANQLTRFRGGSNSKGALGPPSRLLQFNAAACMRIWEVLTRITKQSATLWVIKKGIRKT
jgi:hypothetical protein